MPKRSAYVGAARPGRLSRGARSRRLRSRSQTNGDPDPELTPERLRELREELEVERLELQADRKRLEQALLSTKSIRERFTELYDFAPMGFATFDERGLIKNINGAGADLLGASVKHSLDKPMVVFVAAPDRRRWFQYLAEVRREDSEVRTEFLLHRADGEESLVEFISIFARVIPEGQGRIRSVFRDVTRQRRAEEAARLAKSQLMFVADSAPVMIARCSSDLRYLFVNQSCARFLRRTPGEIIGKPIAEVIGKEAFESIRPYVEKVLHGEAVEFEQEVPYRDVGPRFMHVAYTPERDPQGRVTGWLAAITDFTERRQMEEALRQSEERHRLIIATALDAVITIDEGGLVTDWNPEAERIFGWSRAEVVGRPLAEMILPAQYREAYQKALQLYRGTGTGPLSNKRIEVTGMRRDGRPFPIELAITRVSAEGRTCFTAFLRDITERKQAEQAMREAQEVLEQRVKERTKELTETNAALRAEVFIRQQAEEESARLAAIVESSLDAIVSFGLDEKIISWNKGAERLYGWRALEVLGRSINVILPPGHRREFAKGVARTRSGEVIEPFETVRLVKDGRRVEVILRLSPVKDTAGRVIGISAMARDISARRLAERALRESEARLQGIMDNSPALIYLKDTQGRYLHFNRRFAEAFRLDLKRDLGKKDEELFPARQAAMLEDSDLKVMHAGVPMLFESVIEQDDGPHTSVVAKFPLFDSSGEIYAIGAVMTDVTERQRLQKEILLISEREQRRIAQDLHDGLGQQLAGICFMSDVLKKNLADSGSAFLEKATTISRFLHATVAQTRGLARGLHPVEDEPHGLMSALRDMAERASVMFKVPCLFRCPEPVLMTDNVAATHLYRIAQEALTNAIRHGRAQRVEIVLSSTPTEVKMAIRDDGIGIGTKKPESDGMGLRIMDYRAQMIGGTVQVRPRGSRGTEVCCALPRETPQT